MVPVLERQQVALDDCLGFGDLGFDRLQLVNAVAFTSVLVEQPTSCDPVIRRDQFAEHEVNALFLRALSNNDQFGLQALEIRVPAGRVPDRLVTHRGEEWVFVQSGVLNLILDDQTWSLKKGDAAHFDAARPHGLGAKDREVRLLAVISAELLSH